MNWRPASPFDSVLADETEARKAVDQAKRELAKARTAHRAAIRRVDEAEAQMTEVRMCADQAQAMGVHCGWQPPSPEDAAIAEDLARKARRQPKGRYDSCDDPSWETACAVLRVCMGAEWDDLLELSGEGPRRSTFYYRRKMRKDYARGMHRLLELATGKQCANTFFSNSGEYD